MTRPRMLSLLLGLGVLPHLPPLRVTRSQDRADGPTVLPDLGLGGVTPPEVADQRARYERLVQRYGRAAVEEAIAEARTRTTPTLETAESLLRLRATMALSGKAPPPPLVPGDLFTFTERMAGRAPAPPPRPAERHRADPEAKRRRQAQKKARRAGRRR